MSFAVQATVGGTSTVVSATTFAAFTAAELDVALDLQVSAESNVTFSESLVATADDSVEVAVKLATNSSIAVQNLHAITLDAPIGPTMIADVEVAMATSISATIGMNIT